ncbi:MAG: phosphotransferase family protein, partial [Promethearchaeota archaeon]
MQLSEIEFYLNGPRGKWKDAIVKQLVEITDGWETEIYAFDVESTKNNKRCTEELVIRMYAGPWAKHKARKEGNLLRRLHGADYPVPMVSLIEEDASHLGHPFVVMERIDGVQMWKLLDSEEEDSGLYHMFCTLFYDLHKLEWHQLVEDPKEAQGLDSKKAILQWIEKFEDRAKEVGILEILKIVEWLREEIERVAFEELSATHNDFHPSNILIDKRGKPFVIDWTAADLMDYRVDLAWTLLLAKIYAGDSMRKAILEGYEKASRKAVEGLRFFEVLGALRRLTDILVSLDASSEGVGLRDGAAEMIREQLDHNITVLDIIWSHTGLELSQVRDLMTRGKI